MATIEDARDDLIRFVTKRDEYGWTHPSVLRDGSLLLDQSYLSECDYVPPPQLMQFAEADIQLVSKIKEWTWQDGALHLSGLAYLTNVENTPDTKIEAWLVDNDIDNDGGTVPVTMERYVDPVIDREVNDSWNSHAGGAFRLVIDPSRLDTRRKWALRLRVRRGPMNGSVRCWTATVAAGPLGAAG